MASIISWLYPEPQEPAFTWYEQLYKQIPEPDPRSDVWFLSEWNPIIAISLYLGGLFYVLPIIMTKWEDYFVDDKIREILQKYNIVFVTMNFGYGIWVLILVILAQYSWICEPCNPKKNGFLENQLVYASWIFLLLKLIEFVDSFLLKAGNRHGIVLNQAYHHVTVYFYAWMGAKYLPTGNTNFYNMYNALNHTVMYSLFKFTDIPLVLIVYTTSCTQFFMISVHSLINILIADCGYPLFASWIILLYMLSFLIMYTALYVYNVFSGNSGDE